VRGFLYHDKDTSPPKPRKSVSERVQNRNYEEEEEWLTIEERKAKAKMGDEQAPETSPNVGHSGAPGGGGVISGLSDRINALEAELHTSRVYGSQVEGMKVELEAVRLENMQLHGEAQALVFQLRKMEAVHSVSEGDLVAAGIEREVATHGTERSKVSPPRSGRVPPPDGPVPPPFLNGALAEAADIQASLRRTSNPEQKVTPQRFFTVDGEKMQQSDVPKAGLGDALQELRSRVLSSPAAYKSARDPSSSIGGVSLHYRHGVTNAFLAGQEISVGDAESGGTAASGAGQATATSETGSARDPFGVLGAEEPEGPTYCGVPIEETVVQPGMLSPTKKEELLRKYHDDPSLAISDPTSLLGIHLGIAESAPRPGGSLPSHVARVVNAVPLSMMAETMKRPPVHFTT